MEREEIPITTYQDFYYSQLVVRQMCRSAVFACNDVLLLNATGQMKKIC